MPAYAKNFSAMGVASVGVAASDPSQAPSMLEQYREVLDEAIVRPIVKMPASALPELDEVVEVLGVLMQVAGRFAPNAPASSPPASSTLVTAAVRRAGLVASRPPHGSTPIR